ncbi:MAG: hypothetical protein ACREH6_08540 [Geminicoccaceae bacterium]
MAFERAPALLLSLVLVVGGQDARAASDADIDRMSNFALLLGRGIGCELDTHRAADMVGAWLERTFPPGSPDQKRYLSMFMEGVRSHAAQQQSGRSPDSCTDIARAFETMRW